MSGVPEHPPTHGAGAYGAVVLAPAAPGGTSARRHAREAAALFARLRADGVLTGLVGPGTGFPGPADVVVPAGAADGADLLTAARLLCVEPEHIAVVTDSPRLVRAAVACGFGLVAGLDGVSGGRLRAAGAHLVIDRLDALEVPLPSAPGGPPWGGGHGGHSAWNLRHDGLDPAREGTREALCTLGNGYLATRGSACEFPADGTHCPGTYLAGVYNRLRTTVDGRTLEHEHLVNAPDWTRLQYRTGDGPWFAPAPGNVLSWEQDLDLRTGVLTRRLRFRDGAGRTTRVTTRRFVSMERRHVAAQDAEFEAEDWSGALTVRTLVDAGVANRNVRDDAALAHHHLGDPHFTRPAPGVLLAEVRTGQSGVGIAVAARTTTVPAARADPQPDPVRPGPRAAGHELRLRLAPGRPARVGTVVAVTTSHDRAISTPALAALAELERAGGVDELLAEHRTAWQSLWAAFAVSTGARGRQSLALNLNTFHVLQTVAAADPDLDAGVPARGLHGEGYRGHVFWDEMFVYPMLTLRRPEWTRALLAYRYRRLPAARAAARAAGHEGAMFPWRSGSDGREETPSALFNPRSGHWMPDNSRLQRHVGLAIAHSVWQYYQATGDTRFLIEQGAELVVEIARFFTSLTTYDPEADRWDIDGVMGPDEYHDGRPGAPGSGLRNNAYTNVMTAWLLTRAVEMVARLEEHYCGPLWQRLDLGEDEVARWDRIRTRLRVPFLADGVIAQFEGYEQLAEFDWEAYRARYGNIGRLDLILEAEGRSPNDHRLTKQADVLMLLYLFSAEELRELLARMGYAFPAEAVRATVEHYTARSAHGSTLSGVVHSWVEARRDRRSSWAYLTHALDSDLADVQGGTTREGVHLGAMAGSVDILTRCYTGLELREDMLWLHPVIPPELPEVSFSLLYRGRPVQLELTGDALRLYLGPGPAGPLRLRLDDRVHELAPGRLHEFPIRSPATPRTDARAAPAATAPDPEPTPHA
ncbi:family 65 glycosyl hydrolase [Kocuria sp. LUK]|uniref:glycosyl hydrolase family 65 protein n=1 Tax=Kocuria sp. LUK TaxID=2897828 RepID=UPI001E2B66CC|nr:glycosyl hydrolase family 65 protein [Kocuria sp. LUK]MCD1146047.1 family 65 glycosyl hydrolase [Kocuria sp. LUK]